MATVAAVTVAVAVTVAATAVEAAAMVVATTRVMDRTTPRSSRSRGLWWTCVRDGIHPVPRRSERRPRAAATSRLSAAGLFLPS